jgi:serine/threonine protein phosphatase PrpC
MPPDDVPLGPSTDAKPIGALRYAMTPAKALDVVAKILHIAKCFERDNLAWQPQPEDFQIEPNGDVALSQARAVGRLLGQSFDVRRVLWAVREALLPEPLVGAGAEAIRFVSGRVSSGSAVEAIARLEEIRRRSMLAPPPGHVAAACDVGLLRERNEDAVVIREGTSGLGDWRVLVVCDGVSSSSRGDIASNVGSQRAATRMEELASALGADASDADIRLVLTIAIHSAHEAIINRAKSEPREPGKDPPGTTIVAALVIGEKIAVGWAGDSRAYLVREKGGKLLTKDHSWLNHAIAMGTVTEGDMVAEPLAHALTRCIGPLEIAEGGGGARPDVVIVPKESPAHLVLCSDGLWCYFPTAESIAEAMRAAGNGALPSALCQVLVDHALARGGQDNVTVAICDL